MHEYQGRIAVAVDHHPLWLEAVVPILRDLGLEVAGKATSAEAGLELVREHVPDILITGITMDGEIDGIELIRRAKLVSSELRAVVLSMYSDTAHIDAALGVGAAAYVIKTAHPEDLRSAIRQAFNHSIYLPGQRPAAEAPVENRPIDVPELTRRELEILLLVAEGHSNLQLGRMLWVTEQTVKFHLSNIYRKLDVANRTEASRWAQVNGLLSARPGQATSAA